MPASAMPPMPIPPSLAIIDEGEAEVPASIPVAAPPPDVAAPALLLEEEVLQLATSKSPAAHAHAGFLKFEELMLDPFRGTPFGRAISARSAPSNEEPRDCCLSERQTAVLA